MTRTRPSTLQHLGYAVGRRLPDTQRDWVRHDLTSRHHAVREVLRTELLYTPVFVVFLLFPGPLWLRGLMVLLGLLLSTFYAVAFLEQNRHRRLEQHGLPTDLVSDHDQRAQERARTAYERTYRS